MAAPVAREAAGTSPEVTTGPWEPPRKSALPAELLRAWDVTATSRTKPVAAKRWRRVAVGLVALAVAGGVVGGIVASNSRSTSTAPPPVVRSYSAPDAPFVAGFPGTPVVSHAAMTLDGIPYVATAYTAFSNQQMFSATIYPFPLGLPTMSAEQFLQIFTSKIAVAQRLNIPGTTPTTYRGLPALGAVMRSPSGTTYTRLLAVLDGHVAYVLMVSGSSSTPNGYANFVTSFHLASS